MKKVLVNMPTINHNGIMILRLLKFKKFQSLGWDVYVNGGDFIKKIRIGDPYQFNKNFKEIKNRKYCGTKINFIFHSLKWNIKSLLQYSKIMKGSFDVIYSPSAVLDLVLLPWIIKIFNKKRIKWVTVFDNIVPITDPGNKIVRFLAWLFFNLSIGMLKRADVIFAISEDLKKFLIVKKFNPEKIIVTGNAIENDLVKKSKKLKKYESDALFIGRINETKGIYDMLKVLDLIKKEIPNFKLSILGSGDGLTENQFRKKIYQMNLNKNVKFLGFVTGVNKFNIIKSCKCFWFLSVSKSESFGIALLEAVCSGLPAFVYDLTPFKKIYKNNEVFFTTKGDYKNVARKVLRLFREKKFNNLNGKLLLGKYSWENIAVIESNNMRNKDEKYI